MATNKLLVEKKNSSGTIIDRFPVKIISARVRQDGDRAVDTAEFVIPITEEVNEGDDLKYIQDDVDVDNLVACWNFHGSTRDESGYDNDGNDGTHGLDLTRERYSLNKAYVRDVQVTALVDVSETTPYVTIANKTHLITGTPNVLDFSGAFDIFLRFRFANNPTTDSVIFSKRTATTGIEVIYTSGGFAKVEITSSSTTTSITGTTNSQGEFPLIRVRRDSSNVIRLYVNGIEEGTSITNSTDLTTTGNGYFAQDYSGSRKSDRDFDLATIRIYTENLSDSDAALLLNNFRVPSIMKFHGNVWKKEEKLFSKKISCKGKNKLFPETNINSEVLDARTTASNGDKNHFVGLDDSELIRQIITEINSSYLVTDFGSTTSVEFIANNSLLSIIQTLLLVTGKAFNTFARDVLCLDLDERTENYLFENGKGCQILSSGEDDSVVINDVGARPQEFPKYQEDTFSAGSGSPTSYTLSQTPSVIDQVRHDSGVISDSNWSVTGQTLTITQTVSGTVTVKYYYNQRYGEIGQLARFTDSTSIAKYGRKSKDLVNFGVLNLNQIALVLGNLRDDFKEANKRVQIKIPTLINYIRINHKVQLINDKIGINYVTGQSIDGVLVKSIEWAYPENTTTIMAGEHRFDGFDLDKFTAETVKSLTNTVI